MCHRCVLSRWGLRFSRRVISRLQLAGPPDQFLIQRARLDTCEQPLEVATLAPVRGDGQNVVDPRLIQTGQLVDILPAVLSEALKKLGRDLERRAQPFKCGGRLRVNALVGVGLS